MPYRTAYEQNATVSGESNTIKNLAMALVHSLPKGAKGINVRKGMSFYRRNIGKITEELSNGLKIPEFMQKYLTALSLFLKAKEAGGMRNFRPFPEERKSHLSGRQMVEYAEQIAQELWKEANLNKNKHKRLTASFSQARDQYEAIAILAKFYSLKKGICRGTINKFVEYLERCSLQSVKDLMVLVLIFYEAYE